MHFVNVCTYVAEMTRIHNALACAPTGSRVSQLAGSQFSSNTHHDPQSLSSLDRARDQPLESLRRSNEYVVDPRDVCHLQLLRSGALREIACEDHIPGLSLMLRLEGPVILASVVFEPEGWNDDEEVPV